MPNKKQELGLIQIITGEGKGKTTSSVGAAVRAIGKGLKVRIIQFFKSSTGEKAPLKKIGVEYFQFKPTHPYFKSYSEKDLKKLKNELQDFWKNSIKGLEKLDLLIIDEIGPAINWKMFKERAILDFLKSKPKNLEIIMTGRDFPDSVKSKADYLSEIFQKKHPYTKGILARKGIEF